MKIIENPLLCTGCTACLTSCPRDAIIMKSDRRGFLFPDIKQDKCVDCGKCVKACPINKPPELNLGTEYYAAINKEDDTRMNSTSGGVFSLLAKDTLNQNGLVYGAAYDHDYKVVHIRVSTVEELSRLQGAKYSQSDLGYLFYKVEEDLKNKRRVLFSGTPCQVAGLKAFLGREYENLLLVDLVCHGVPSPKAWKTYIDYREKNDSQFETPSSINLRSKGSGWSKYGYAVSVSYPSGFHYERKNNDDYYMISFINNMTIRPSCNECHFKGIHRCSDITLGDFWGIWDIKPEMDDDKGTSLVLVHSRKGKEVWERIEMHCLVCPVEREDTFSQNPSLVQSSEINPLRDTLLERLDQESFKAIEKEVENLKKSKNKRRGSIIRKVVNKMEAVLWGH